MRKIIGLAAALLAASIAAPAMAQSEPPPYRPSAPTSETNPLPTQSRCWDTTTGKWARCSAPSGGSVSSGDASAANQTSQITAANLTNARLGDITAPALGTVNGRLGQITATLGTPFQAGGMIGNTQFGASQVGPWSVNLGTGGAGTAATPLIVDALVRGTSTDRGAIIGASAVTLMVANSSRRGFSIQNQSASASCYINGQGTASADYHSLLIAPGTFYETPDSYTGTAAISIICSAAGTSVYARER